MVRGVTPGKRTPGKSKARRLQDLTTSFKQTKHPNLLRGNKHVAYRTSVNGVKKKASKERKQILGLLQKAQKVAERDPAVVTKFEALEKEADAVGFTKDWCKQRGFGGPCWHWREFRRCMRGKDCFYARGMNDGRAKPVSQGGGVLESERADDPGSGGRSSNEWQWQ